MSIPFIDTGFCVAMLMRMAVFVRMAMLVRRWIGGKPHDEATAYQRSILMVLYAAFGVRAEIEPADAISDGGLEFRECVKNCRDKDIAGYSAKRIEVDVERSCGAFAGHLPSPNNFYASGVP